MNTISKRRLYSPACIFVLTIFTLETVLPADLPNWALNLEHGIRFHRALDENMMLVGTERHLFGIDVKQGKTVWRFRNVQVESHDVLIFRGTSGIGKVHSAP